MKKEEIIKRLRDIDEFAKDSKNSAEKIQKKTYNSPYARIGALEMSLELISDRINNLIHLI
jgi:hypothetical protein